MPGSRRPLSRMQATPPPVIKPKLDNISNTNGDDGVGPGGLPMPPKHAHIPEIAPDDNFMFEGMVFLFSLVSMSLQYINLYKTVWWLPHSHAMYAINFHLIDKYLLLFLCILMGRRVLYSLINEINVNKSKHPIIHWVLQVFKGGFLSSSVCLFITTTYHIILRHSLIYALFLCYPLVTYFILFRLKLKPLFSKLEPVTGVTSHPSTPTQGVSSSSTPTPSSAPSSAPTTPPSPDISFPSLKSRSSKDKNRTIIQHNCNSSPEAVREEVEQFKTDFNSRIKQVLFNSMVCAYYTGFIPLCFAQNTLYYDAWWVGQHVVLIWFAAFVMYAVHFLPIRYLDMLHRCSLHLGRWTKVEGRHAHVPYNAWSELQVWQQGSLVKHVRGLFRAEGINNSAEPGNGTHSRFYFLFQPPLRMTVFLLVLTLALVVYQFLLLVQAMEWVHILSLAFLLFSNYCALFKLIRDYLVLKRAYKDEQTSQ